MQHQHWPPPVVGLTSSHCCWTCRLEMRSTACASCRVRAHIIVIITCSRGEGWGRPGRACAVLHIAFKTAPSGPRLCQHTCAVLTWRSVPCCAGPHTCSSCLPVWCVWLCGTGDRLAFKAVDGRMAVIAWPSGKQLSSWRVPGFSSTASSSSSSFSTRCSFGHTADGQIVCVGAWRGTACERGTAV